MTYYSLKWATAHCTGPASQLEWTGFVGPGPAACVCVGICHNPVPKPHSARLTVPASVPACFSATIQHNKFY